MAKSGFPIASIVRTYHWSILSSRKKNPGDETQPSQRKRVEISLLGRKKQVCQRARNQVIKRLTRGKSRTPPLVEESQ